MICTCYKYNKGEERIAAPYGNDFNLHICHSNVAPGGPDGATFADIVDLKAYLVKSLGARIEMDYDITEYGDLLVYVPADKQERTIYGLELTGTYNGHAWRWKASAFISIVEDACDNSLVGSETFAPDTYYLDDSLFVSTLDDTMIFVTEGHASLANNTLTIQATEETEVYIEEDTLVIIQN